jgi:lipopolysaccharide transport system ATP-binding protein
MNNDVAIKAINISKYYRLYDNHIDRFKESLHPMGKLYHKKHKALDGVSFEIKKGEAVGVIGRNGAGKSTLLKIITGVSTQSHGEIKVDGRIASLLELGAGFNPELTGYENVYFNAVLLGLTDEEVDLKIDDILSFADIGKYIFQPVKTYSSGMFVRLAFAIIAHVDADILIVDEALAVGDALFVQKCMNFIRDFVNTKTLFFVSHDNSAIIDLCSRVIWIDNGVLKKDGNPKDVCDKYLYTLQKEAHGVNIKLLNESNSVNIEKAHKKNSTRQTFGITNNLINSKNTKTGFGEIFEVTISKVIDGNAKVMEAGDLVNLTIKAKVLKEFENPIVGFLFLDAKGRELFGENTYSITNNRNCRVYYHNTITAKFKFKLPMLRNGDYVVMAALSSGNPYKHTHHHYVHEGLIVSVLHEKLVFGLVGIDLIDKNINIEEV